MSHACMDRYDETTRSAGNEKNQEQNINKKSVIHARAPKTWKGCLIIQSCGAEEADQLSDL